MIFLKVDFIDNEHFTIYYLTSHKFQTEVEMKNFFKLLNHELKHQIDYEFHGFYNVDIFWQRGLYILDFENVVDYGSGDFNITMLLNSTILYQFPDSDMVSGEKIYYHGNFYTEIENVIDDIHFFEYGKVIFGEQVNDILNHGILVTM